MGPELVGPGSIIEILTLLRPLNAIPGEPGAASASTASAELGTLKSNISWMILGSIALATFVVAVFTFLRNRWLDGQTNKRSALERLSTLIELLGQKAAKVTADSPLTGPELSQLGMDDDISALTHFRDQFPRMSSELSAVITATKLLSRSGTTEAGGHTMRRALRDVREQQDAAKGLSETLRSLRKAIGREWRRATWWRK